MVCHLRQRLPQAFGTLLAAAAVLGAASAAASTAGLPARAAAMPQLAPVPSPLYVSSGDTDQVLRYNGTTGAFIDVFVTAGSGGLDHPEDLVFGPDGNLYVSSLSTDEVLRYSGATGAFVDAFVSAGSGGLSGPIGLVFGPDGNLYVSSWSTNEILRYNGTTGTFVDAFASASSGGLVGPAGLVFGADGNLYVSSLSTDEVLRYSGATGAFVDAFVSGGSGGLSDPVGLVFGPDGDLYVSSEFTNEVLRYNGATGAFVDAFVSASSGGLTGPMGLTFAPTVDLSILKTDTPSTALAGESLTYEVTVANAGPDLAAGVVVTDVLPSEVQFLGDTTAAGCTQPVTGTLSCSLGSVPAGESTSFQVLTRVAADAVSSDPDGTIVVFNTAQVTSNSTEDDPSNNITSQGTFVVDSADLQVVKMSQPDTTVRAGEVFTYTIFVDNLGPSYARDVTLHDDILSSGTYDLLRIIDDPDRLLDACTPSPTPGGTSIVCELNEPLEVQGDPPGNGRWVIRVEVRANEAQEVSNLVQVYTGGSGTPDPELSNNHAEDFISVTAVADLEIAKTALGQVQVDGQPGGTFAPVADQVTAGGVLTYALTITNRGPSTAENVVVQDYLPASIVVSATAPSQGTCNSGIPGDPAAPLTCNLGSLAPSHAITITMIVAVPPGESSETTWYNEAHVSSATFDSNNTNDFDTNLTSVDSWADLAVGKVGPPDPVALGQQITYVITVCNSGPSDNAAATVSDPVPAGLADVTWGCTASGSASCTANGSGGISDTVGLPAGEMVTYTLQARLAARVSVTNTVTVTTQSEVPDPKGDNNTALFTNAPEELGNVVFLPLVASGSGVSGPDLVVEEIAVTPNDVQLTIRNRGNAPVVTGFWVDVYLDPTRPPEAVDEVWGDLADEGMVWGVTASALPLAAGQALVLTVGDGYYSADNSRVSWPLSPGTTVYAQVDSYGAGSGYGTVEETHEMTGGAYNNIAGPVYSP